MSVQTIPHTHNVKGTGVHSWKATFHFVRLMGRANLRDWRTTGVMIFTPLIMLFVFAFGASDEGGQEVLSFVFPAIVSMSVFFAGAPFATRIVTWREHKVFRRLACTPTPVGWLVAAYGAVYVGIALLQAVVVLLIGRGLLGVNLHGQGALLALGPLALTACCFAEYGALIASLVRKTETVNVVYIFTLLPMVFMGPAFTSNDRLPGALRLVGEWLPASVSIKLVRPLLETGHLPEQAALLTLVLAGYTLLFAVGAVFLFRRNAWL